MSTPAAEKTADVLTVLGKSPKELRALGDARHLSLNDAEWSAVQAHFKALKREPSLAEVETIAQTWSEHCKHKTFTSPIRYTEGKKTRTIKNLFQETIVAATAAVKKPWCLSVFEDNAGVVAFGKKWALAFKAETHNHPSALEPYGGAETGVGGVVRDVLGCGLGAKPVLNTDVFCFGRPDFKGALPEGAHHPSRTLRGVVSGVRDYGNRMGIPTAAGGIWFDDEYRLNPLVFVGTVGLLPQWAVKKSVKAGDLIVAAGGRTGRDGLHGATFSSANLGADAPSSAVQIGHAIAEKRALDAVLRARDKKLYASITDCGAGGFSSAIGELGAKCGAHVRLEAAPLKMSDLDSWEIWLSESQERMVMAVPPKNLKALEAVFAAEGCETAVIGEFTRDGRLLVTHHDATVVDLDMKFLHHGLPRVEREAVWTAAAHPKASGGAEKKLSVVLREAVAHLNVCSREWVIRQYDHEVQGGTVIKPLQGVRHDGPGDACVMWPHAATGDMDDFSGFTVAHGLNPDYGRIDPYWMAMACVDEALRNLTCVGGDPSRAALLDNFCWASPADPKQLGALVRAAEGCRDAAKGFSAPFISGKDSLYNQSKDEKGKELPIPGTLLISALAPVPDVRKSITMDFKGPGNALYLIGRTNDELGGSLYHRLLGRAGGEPPKVTPAQALDGFKSLHAAILKGQVLSAHDLSDGGLAVCASEMGFSGEFGCLIDLDEVPRDPRIYSNETLLFSESPSRILVEVTPENESAFLRHFGKGAKAAPVRRVGQTTANPILKVVGLDGSSIMEEPLSELKNLWQKTLPGMLG
ncbi:MAG: phosphoribosylformylglycinamidine synthase subunit PurL [Elusimicrobia bacterium]|nr:phosphoribosylformylglycinamidine synthase subunit PurL [Elusimicrobiota bacterium]MDE2510311.1 phosphoribosylformylglycinamidine synthase subunit PurL [Elusimicrobiota bacterium]